MRKLILASAMAATALTGLAPASMAQGRYQGGQGGYQGGNQGGGQGGGLPGGTWTTVCRNGSMNNGVLSAECKDAVGQYHYTSLPIANCRGDIGDQNGTLACAGATGTAGGVVQAQQQQQQRRDDRRGNNNGAVVGAGVGGLIAGALLGGALAGNNGAPPPPPPPPPPSYGDPRYGDPRFDWRYQQGGYGYGRRQGEWIPIAERADWLNRQIDRLLQDRRIDFRDARDYRRQLDGITFQERDMQRYGRLGPRQRDELDRRFNDLADEIRRDARED